MLLSIIIVSYNTASLTLQTVKSALSEILSSDLLKNQTEIWLVDNHSSDDSVTEVQKLKLTSLIPIHIIANKENLGFAVANNQAIEQSSGELVLLLNSDTILQAGCLSQLVSDMQKIPNHEGQAVTESHAGKLDHLGILAAELVNQDDSIQPQGGSFPNLVSLAAHMLGIDDFPIIGQHLPSTQHTGKRTSQVKSQGLTQQDWVGGAAMLLRRSMLLEIGLLDQSIFMYGEDVELCMRAKYHHWDVAIDHRAKITHLGSASSSSKNAIIGELKGYRYIWAKHYPHWQLPIARALLKTGCLLRIGLFGTMIHSPEKVAAYRQALGLV